jgi:hypothetical protein
VCYCVNDGDGTITNKKQAASLNCLEIFMKIRCGVAGNDVADCLAKKVIQKFSQIFTCDLRCSGMLRSVHWWLVTGVSGQPIGAVFKGQAVQGEYSRASVSCDSVSAVYRGPKKKIGKLKK